MLALLVCWSPALVEQLTNDPGNLSELEEFSGGSGTITAEAGDSLQIYAEEGAPAPQCMVEGPSVGAGTSQSSSISDGETSWGVTALQAVEEMDAGPIWGYRTFAMPADAPRKSSLYNGEVTRAAWSTTTSMISSVSGPSLWAFQ